MRLLLGGTFKKGFIRLGLGLGGSLLGVLSDLRQ